MRKNPKRWFGTIVAALLVGLIPAVVAAGTPATSRVVVAGKPGERERVKASVARLGGTWVANLDAIDGGTAVVPSASIVSLSASAGVTSVTIDDAASSYSFEVPGQAALEPIIPATLWDVAAAVATQPSRDRGVVASNVDIAMIDSGVAPVVGLDTGRIVYLNAASGRIVPASEAEYDIVGHGTHLASILLAKDSSEFGPGIARGSRLVSVNASNKYGQASLTSVLLGVDAVIKNKNNGLNIRVLLMAIGFDRDSPAGRLLMIASERATASGILVVAAAGNKGQWRGQLEAPAASQHVLAVGAYNLRNPGDPRDDWAASFTSVSSARPADILAPGVSIVGLRDPGSVIDTLSPAGRIGSTGFRGSGSSQASAVAAGAAALLFAQRPTLTPYEARAALIVGNRPIPFLPGYVGNGRLNLEASLQSGKLPVQVPPATQPLQWGTTSALVQDDLQAGELSGTRWIVSNWSGTRWITTATAQS